MDIIEKAANFAKNVHTNQKRKDGSNYYTHPFEVASILKENDASDILICAGYLHDTIEDASISKETLSLLFPEEVVDLILLDSEDKNLDWETRKEIILDRLQKSNNLDFKKLMCADKLANLRSIEKELLNGKNDIWGKFKKDKESQKWLYHEVLLALQELANTKMYQELETLYNKIFMEEKNEFRNKTK